MIINPSVPSSSAAASRILDCCSTLTGSAPNTPASKLEGALSPDGLSAAFLTPTTQTYGSTDQALLQTLVTALTSLTTTLIDTLTALLQKLTGGASPLPGSNTPSETSPAGVEPNDTWNRPTDTGAADGTIPLPDDDSAADTVEDSPDDDFVELPALGDDTSDSEVSDEIPLDPGTETTDVAASDETDSATNYSGSIESTLRGILSATGKTTVDEERLQHGINYCLLKQQSASTAAFYKKTFEQCMAAGGSHACAEEAAASALAACVSSGKISRVDAEEINGVSFRAAQLDNHLDMLFDDHGGESDNTIATAKIDTAVKKAVAALAGIENGSIQAPPRDLDAPNNKPGMY